MDRATSIVIPSDYDRKLQLYMSLNGESQKDAILKGLDLLFDTFQNLGFIDEATNNIVEDDSSIKITKEAYARLNKMSLMELEKHIKKYKLKTVSLATGKKDKRVSYICFDYSNQHSLIAQNLKLQYENQSITIKMFDLMNRVSVLEDTVESLSKK